jgi:NAD-dependent dihydropyrimidine dehydrogenase PreA subunit
VSKKRRIAPSRVAQIVSTVLLNAYILAYIQNKIIYQGFFKHIPEPVLNCYGGPLSVFACPIGSLQQMVGIHSIPWLPIGVFVVVGALVGRAACGWLCPFGMWQDLLEKIKVGPRAGARRWVSFGVIAGIAALIGVTLVAVLHLPLLPVFVYAWLPFTAAVLFVAIRGKFDIPRRLWLGGWLAAVGLGILVWLKFGAAFGVVAGVVGMVLFGLTGRWFASIGTAVAGFALAAVAPGFGIGHLHGVALAAAVAVAAFIIVFVLDRLLKASLPSTFLKFAFLFVIAVVVAYKTGEPWFCKLCPQGTFEAGIPLVVWDPVHALRSLVGWLYWVKIGILLLVVVAAIAIRRPFCRLICPIGAVYSVFNKGSMLHMRLDGNSCTQCNVCRRVCPMSIEPHEGPNQLECIRCFECVWNCPKTGLSIKA